MLPSSDDIGGAWRAMVIVDPAHLDAFETAFTDLAYVVSLYETVSDSGIWAVEGMFHTAPPRDELAARIALVASSLGVAEPDLVIAQVPPKDWLTATIASFPPLRAGRFYIHGDHVPPPYPPGALRLCINAATAFGSGQHASTMGCLLAIDTIAKSRPRPTRALDMGCGTGILALAMVKAWSIPVLAADIDPVAVKVARYNARRNGLAPFIEAVMSEGTGQREVAQRGPYDVITANILARPLAQMSAALSRLLAPGGHLILAGFHRRDERLVMNPYRDQGLSLVRRWDFRPWTTLLFRRPQA